MYAYRGSGAYYSTTIGEPCLSRSNGTITVTKDGTYAVADFTDETVIQDEYSAGYTWTIPTTLQSHTRVIMRLE